MFTHPTLISEEPLAEIAGSEGPRAACDSVSLGRREQERRKRDSIMPSRSQRWGWRVGWGILRENAVHAEGQGSVLSASMVADNHQELQVQGT